MPRIFFSAAALKLAIAMAWAAFALFIAAIAIVTLALTPWLLGVR